MYTIKELEVLNDMPVDAFAKDDAGRYVWANKQWLKGAGVRSFEEVRGKTDHELVWKENADRLVKADKEVIENQKTLRIQEKVHSADRGDIVANVCKFPATIDGKKCLIGIAVILT